MFSLGFPGLTLSIFFSDTQKQDEECLKAEKLLKSLLSIDTSIEKNESDIDAEVDPGSVEADEVSERSDPSEPRVKYSESNSNDSTDYPTLSEAKTKRRRRRRTRKRKGKCGFMFCQNFESVSLVPVLLLGHEVHQPL